MATSDDGDDLARLRQAPENLHLLGGFGPLVVGAILFVLMVLLAPTIAPERVVEEPVRGTTTTALEIATTTTAAAATTSTPTTAAAP